MGDERLRALEQRWLETKSVEDEETWISECVRAGVLERERVVLAGRFGHPAAQVFGEATLESGEGTFFFDWAKKVTLAAQEASIDPRLVLLRLAIPTAEWGLGRVTRDLALERQRALLRFVVRPSTVNEGRLTQQSLHEWEEPGAALYGIAVAAPYPRQLEMAASKFSWEAGTGRGELELIRWLLGRGDPIAERLKAL